MIGDPVRGAPPPVRDHARVIYGQLPPEHEHEPPELPGIRWWPWLVLLALVFALLVAMSLAV